MEKIYIWGTGNVCSNLIANNAFNMEIVHGFVETKRSQETFENKKIYEIGELVDYDCIFVAVKRPNSIYELCGKYSIDLNRVCFVNPCLEEANVDKNLHLAQKFMTDSGYRSICEHYHVSKDDWVKADADIYERLNTRDNFKIQSENNFYIMGDKFESAGEIGSYFWQDLWAAKKIVSNNPNIHYDIGSRVDGFVAHVLAANIQVNLIDIRPLKYSVNNLSFVCADATNLDGIEDNSIGSLSALCSLEHFGLGRYGDPIDPEACFKCFDAIQRKVCSGGDIYISVPIGKEHLEFNAHRVFYASTIRDSFKNCYLKEFSSAKNALYEENVDIHKYDNDASLGGSRFGLFHFVKI